MAIPINLANVNITIQQFQEIASGKFNAGEVALTSATTFGKIDVTEEITFDLTGDNPRITDVRLGQKIAV